MASVLIIAEHQGGKLISATAGALACGKQIADAHGLSLEAAIVGKDMASLAAELSTLGASKVYQVEADGLENYLSEHWAKAVADLASKIGATYVGAASTVQGRDYLPRVAARLDAGMASNVVCVEGEAFVRPMWADAVLAKVEITTPIKLFSVRSTEFAPLATGAVVSVEVVAPELTVAKVEFGGLELVKSERPALTDAKVVVAGGRGTKGDFGPIEALADLLGAAIGSTRRRRRGLGPERVPGRADRQGRRPRALHRGGHQRRDSAFGWHEGVQSDRGDQQGRRGADLPGRGLWPRGRSLQGRPRDGRRD